LGVEGIGSALNAQASSAQTPSFGNSDLKISDFFQLIAAQLQNQSMYDTVDNAEFMSQMVQFSTLSQMEELSNAFQSNLAVSMIGKTVNVTTEDDRGMRSTTTGVVSQVNYEEGVPRLLVGGAFYKMADVTEVGMGNSAGVAQG
jgi:flagellar basal-body rod modification protein FlgD